MPLIAWLKPSRSKASDYQNVQLDQSEVTGPYARLGHGAVQLLVPEAFDLEGFSQAINGMLVEGGLVYRTNTQVMKSLDEGTKVAEAKEPDAE
jgi:hypothetical protein